jgi:hypothetical protein
MSGSAQVNSIDAIQTLREALAGFRADAAKALEAAEQDVRHFFDWLDDQQKHWKKAVRECEEHVLRAKTELVAKRYTRMDGRGEPTTEKEVALKKAQARLRYAEEKVQNCRRWANVLPRAVTEYEGPARQLAGMLDTEVRHAMALLDHKLETLDAYVHMAPPPAPSLEPAGDAAEAAPGNGEPDPPTPASPASNQAAAPAAVVDEAAPEPAERRQP